MKNKTEYPLSDTSLVSEIIYSLHEVLAENIVTIDLRNLPGATDWFIVCQGDNPVHNRACAERIIEHLKKNHSTHLWQHEGLDEGRWILLDYSDVVVHIMLPELRSYYYLEELWSEGKVTKIESVGGVS